MAKLKEGRVKRRKLNPELIPKSVEVTSSEQLQELLRFRQSNSLKITGRIKSVTKFLSSISSSDDTFDRATKLEILKQFCGEKSSRPNDESAFPDLFLTWSYAVQSEYEPLLSIVPELLAQFLDTTSALLDFRDFNTALCNNLLKHEHVELIAKGLSASKSNSRLVVPCLRLLTEIVEFDGGIFANRTYAYRHVLLKRFDVYLDHIPSKNDASDENVASADVRKYSLQLLLALFTFLDRDALARLVGSKAVYFCLKGLMYDGADKVISSTEALRGIVFNTDLSKQDKSKLLTPTMLTFLAQLYEYDDSAVSGEETSQNPSGSVQSTVHNFLVQICTSSEGCLFPQTGWYPPGMNVSYQESDDNAIDLGLDAPNNTDNYTSNVPIKNTILSTFIRNLKPEKYPMQGELLRKIFHAAPELVADYFIRKHKFSMAPKDDPIWRGQFAFFFSVIQLPVPETYRMGKNLPFLPPPCSIVIESVLPRPFDKNTILRCLNKSEEILTLSAARLMTVAIQKLDAILVCFRSVDSRSHLWQQFSHKLIEFLIQRLPSVNEVIAALQRTAVENFNIRAILLECISTYYRLLPEATLTTKFDIGSILADILERLDSKSTESSMKDVLCTQLIHIVTIANLSPATKWWHKSDANSLSPFFLLLKFYSSTTVIEVRRHVGPILRDILIDRGILHPKAHALEALIVSLGDSQYCTIHLNTLRFIDDCIIRTMQKPVKYYDRLIESQQKASDTTHLSLLACCIIDQWPFVLRRANSIEIGNVLVWILRFYTCLKVSGENSQVLKLFQQEVTEFLRDRSTFDIEKVTRLTDDEQIMLLRYDVEEKGLPAVSTEAQGTADAVTTVPELEETFGQPKTYPDSVQGLDKWVQIDVEMELQSGRLIKLLHCVSSKEEDTRRQCFHILQTVMHHVDSSSYTEKQQIFLLLGEVCETVKNFGFDMPLPSIVSEVAQTMLEIVVDPSNKMYSKANRFLLRGPFWEVSGLISYWIDKILLSEPEHDDGYEYEVNVLMKILVNGLNTTADMELYRRSNLFERILSFYSSPRCPKTATKSILQIIYRAIQAGGSDTLITRVGIRAWLSIIRSGEHEVLVTQLQQALSENCNRTNIERWENARPIFRLKH